MVTNIVYAGRLEALEQTWQVWAELGRKMTEPQWSSPTRCPGWDVAALYAHHSGFPVALSAPPPPPARPTGEPITAVEVLRRFNAPGGAASTLAQAVADQAVTQAAQHDRGELVDRFRVLAPRVVDRLRTAQADLVVPWPAAEAGITLVETLRIVLMEATVHLLDLQRALELAPDVPAAPLGSTVRLLAEVAPAVELIEAATGRSATSPLPVLR
jgi:uncharacterized protein (TIGR03083 family)